MASDQPRSESNSYFMAIDRTMLVNAASPRKISKSILRLGLAAARFKPRVDTDHDRSSDCGR